MVIVIAAPQFPEYPSAATPFFFSFFPDGDGFRYGGPHHMTVADVVPVGDGFRCGGTHHMDVTDVVPDGDGFRYGRPHHMVVTGVVPGDGSAMADPIT